MEEERARLHRMSTANERWKRCGAARSHALRVGRLRRVKTGVRVSSVPVCPIARRERNASRTRLNALLALPPVLRLLAPAHDHHQPSISSDLRLRAQAHRQVGAPGCPGRLSRASPAFCIRATLGQPVGSLDRLCKCSRRLCAAVLCSSSRTSLSVSCLRLHLSLSLLSSSHHFTHYTPTHQHIHAPHIIALASGQRVWLTCRIRPLHQQPPHLH